MIYQKAASRFVNANPLSYFVFIFLGIELINGNYALAGEVTILNVESSCKNNTCRFDVTLEHEDTGWEHYADFWQIVTAEGIALGRRVLLHPHVNEQPFTRSLSGVNIPENTDKVWVEAHDSLHGMSPLRFEVKL